MKIILAGGSGQVGTLLARAFHASGDEVIVLGRTPAPAPWRTVAWNPAGGRAEGPWTSEIDGADVVVGLAGRSVDCRYTPANRAAILNSRVDSTRAVGASIAAADRPPRVWLQMSTATIYAHRLDAPNDETTGQISVGADAPDAWRFSLDVAQAWEAALNEHALPNTRRVALRAAMVMSPDAGGVFSVLLRLVRAGLGGRMGSGRQYVSWIHDADFVAAARWLLSHDEVSGPVNLAAPEPLPNADFMRSLRAAWGMPVGLPAAPWMLEVGAFALRTETELLLKSRRVVPGRLLDSGFTFRFPTWPEAARDLCARVRTPS